MASNEVRIRDGDALVKVRNPVTVALLALVTFGIYGIFWYYYINREMADLGRIRGTTELGDSPGKSVLAITLGALVIVPAVISLINTCKRAEKAQRFAGRAEPLSVGLAVVLMLFLSVVGIWYLQNELNKVWATEAGDAADQQSALPGEGAVPQPGATEAGGHVGEQPPPEQRG